MPKKRSSDYFSENAYLNTADTTGHSGDNLSQRDPAVPPFQASDTPEEAVTPQADQTGQASHDVFSSQNPQSATQSDQTIQDDQPDQSHTSQSGEQSSQAVQKSESAQTSQPHETGTSQSQNSQPTQEDQPAQQGTSSRPSAPKFDKEARAGFISLVLVLCIMGIVFVGVKVWGTPGEDGSKLRPTPAQSSQPQKSNSSQPEGMHNGPYETVNYSEILVQKNPKYICDSTLMVVNNAHPLPNDLLFPKLVKVPYEQAEAEPNTAEAYKLLNNEIDHKFGTPVDLDRAAIPAKNLESAEPSNVDNILGLALDLRAPSYKLENFGNSPKGKFVLENAAQFGLILRYPAEKADKTGVNGLSYKFRYVGIPHAQFLLAHNLCLDEYPEFLGENKEFEYGGYVISRQKGPQLLIPLQALDVHISPDNTGYYIVTARMDGTEKPAVGYEVAHTQSSSSSSKSESTTKRASEEETKKKRSESDNSDKKKKTDTEESSSKKKSSQDENQKSKSSSSQKKDDDSKKSSSSKSSKTNN